MRADDVQSTDPILHGAYVCLPAEDDLAARAERLGLRNEFEPGDGAGTYALLRRVSAQPRDIADGELLRAPAIMHVAARDPEIVDAFCGSGHVLRGVLRPPVYSGAAMFNYAYAHRVLPAPGNEMPNAFLVPMSKTDAWWRKDWMERHTYFLPRYDDEGRMVSRGHARAAEAGIDCLLRRTYKSASEPAPDGAYDFLNYFECADADVPTFEAVCARLRDVADNPEWRYVREGPTWRGRRVATWDELLA